MVGSLIMTAALMGQVSPARIDWKAEPASAKAAAAAKAKALAAGAGPAAAGRAAKAAEVDFNNGARRRRQDAAWRQRVLAERRQAAEQAKAQVEYEKRYREMLPYMLEEQRQYLDRLSAIERNAALANMADAQQRQAGAMQSQANALWWQAYRNGR